MRYFAYGNLLDIDIMRRIAPSVRSLGVMRLDDHEIAFARCADPSQAGCTLDETRGSQTWGVQYEMSDEDMAALDKAAGVPVGHWEHKEITLIDQEGRATPSVTYVIPKSSGRYSPPDSYVAPIFKGADAFGLPDDYVKRLKEIIDDAQASAR